MSIYFPPNSRPYAQTVQYLSYIDVKVYSTHLSTALLNEYGLKQEHCCLLFPEYCLVSLCNVRGLARRRRRFWCLRRLQC